MVGEIVVVVVVIIAEDLIRLLELSAWSVSVVLVVGMVKGEVVVGRGAGRQDSRFVASGGRL